jgi:hypothetical protein
MSWHVALKLPFDRYYCKVLFQKTMDITTDYVKEEKDLNPLPNVQSPHQDFCNVVAGQEYGLQSLTQVFLKEETFEEKGSKIEHCTQVFIKEEAAETKFPAQVVIIKEESAELKEEIYEGQVSNNTSEDSSFR